MSKSITSFYKTRAFLLTIYFIPVVLLLGFVVSFSANVPILDEWSTALLLNTIHTGQASFNDFFAQHNEHRIFFPRLIFVALASLSSWNVVYEQYGSILLALATFGIIYRLSWEQAKHRGQTFIFHLANLLTCLLIFSLVQYENWLWGFQLSWFLINVCLALAIFFIHSNLLKNWVPIARLSVSAIFCSVASFSLAHGLFTWLAVIPSVILMVGNTRQRISRIILWMGLFIASSSLYFIGYQKPSHHPDTLFFLKQPLSAAAYFLTFVGSSLVRNPRLAIFAGLLVSSLFIIWTLYFIRTPKLTAQATPWLSIGLFSILFALVTTIGRAGFGIGQASASRYTTTSLLLVISIIQMWHLYLCYNHQVLKFLGEKSYKIFAGALVTIFSINSVQIIPQGQKIYEQRQASSRCLEFIYFIDESVFKEESPSICLREIFPSPIALKSFAEPVEQMGLRDFPKDINFISETSQIYGAIDQPITGKTLSVTRNESVTLGGWAVLPHTFDVPKLVWFSQGDNRSFLASAYVNLDSPDIAQKLNSRRYRQARWSVEISPQSIPPGERETVVKAWVYNPHKKQFTQLNGELKLNVVE